MNVISVPGQSGRSYSVRIAGDTPTPEEQARIDSFIAQREASTAANIDRFLGPTTEQAAAEAPQGGIGTAFGVGVDTLQQGYGSTLEGIGSILGVEGIQRYGQKVAEANAREAAEKAQALTGREDVQDIGSAFSFLGETLAQQVPQLGVSLGGSAAGAAAGAFGGPVGVAAGAIIGGLAANLPFFYGQNRERQKEAIELGLRTEVDEGAAFLTSLPQAALDTIVDRMLIGKVINPDFIRAGGIFTRAVKGGAAGAAVEVPTEIGQAVLERYQAGLPIDSEDAIREYEDVAIAAGLVGGTLSGTANVVGGDIREEKKRAEEKEALAQLDEDIQEQAVDAANRLRFGLAAADKEAQEQSVAPNEETLYLPKPSRLDPQQEVIATTAAAQGKMDDLKAGNLVPTSQRTFELAQYDDAVEKVRKNGNFNAATLQKALAKKSGGTVPMSVVRDIRDEMVRRGVLRADTNSTSGYAVEPEIEAPFSEADSFQKTIDGLDRTIEADRKERERAAQEARRLQQTGAAAKDVRVEAIKKEQAEARIQRAEKTRAEVMGRLANVKQSGVVPTTERPRSLLQPGQVVARPEELNPQQAALAVTRRAENIETTIGQYNERIRQQRAILNRLKADAKKVQLSQSERDQMAMIEQGIASDTSAVKALQSRLKNKSAEIQIAQEQARANEARAAAAKAMEAPRTPTYTKREEEILEALRKRLGNLGLSDVRLTAEKLLRPKEASQGVLVQGVFNVKDGNRMIALALGIYDPKMTQDQQLAAIAGTLNHEVIHALRNLGLFTDAEWRSLSELARRQKYMAVKGGVVKQRQYTYFQRAQQMYADANEDVQVEEAVAEMFRDWVDGRLKIGGKPRSLMERIKNFFRAIWGAHQDAGIDPNTIFEGIELGKIGGRDRNVGVSKADTEMQSQQQIERAKATQNFDAWFAPSVTKDENGQPVVYYTGTSKDKDFTSFNVGRHGGWFTTDPTEASNYAFENDSMNLKYDGGRYVRTNTASRVMPVFLRITNPYRGPLPAWAMQDNYKKAQSDFFDVLRSQGYDGWMPDSDGSGLKPSIAVVLKEPQQIKSVFASTFDADKKDMRYSSIKLPENLRRYTILGIYDEKGQFRNMAPVDSKGKRQRVNKEVALTNLHKMRGRKAFTSDPKDVRAMALMMAAEAEAALMTDTTAIGWYDDKLRAAKDVTALLHPEIKTDPGMEAAFDFALAVTSNGEAVVNNHSLANQQYEALKTTGRFPEVGFGKQGTGMVTAFRFYNALLDRGFDHVGIADYLSQETTVGQLKKDPILKDVGIKPGGKEWADTKVNVSYVLGPKIGQGFYQNLRGNFEPLTMDRWWVRMFNRLAGNQFVKVTDERLKKNIEDFKTAARGELNSYERSILTDAIAETMVDVTTDDTAIRIAREVNRLFQRDFAKAGKDARPVKSAFFQTANTLSDNSKTQVEEAPRGAAERAFMRDVASRARDMVNDVLRQSGMNQSLTMADFQALMWYAEKRLWDAMGIPKGKGGEHDYVDSAIELVRGKGFTDEQITQALPGAERYRIDPERYPREQDGGLRRQPAEGGAAEASDERFSRLRIKGTGDRDGRGRGPGRGLAPLEGAPTIQGASGPDPNLIKVAEEYARSIGIDLKRQSEFVEVDEDRAKRIAAAYDAMPHDPQNPVVREAYRDLVRQVRAQHDALTKAGYVFTFFDSSSDPYAKNPWNAMRDLRANKRMAVYGTYDGYGTEGITSQELADNPMLEDTGLRWEDQSGTPRVVTANDLFRAVHDALGHGIEGAGFRARGEENAWQAHIRLFTGPAQAALTSETRGQNSWLNYGPYGENNRNATLDDTVFAQNKIGVMPEWTWKEGRAGDMEFPGTARFSRLSALPAMSKQSMAQVPQNQRGLMYARSADVIGKVLNLKGYGLKQESVDNFLRKFQDSMLPVGRMVQELSQRGLTITDAMDPYLQEELMHGVVGHRIEQNQNGLYEPATEAIKKLNVSDADIDRLKKASDAAAGGGNSKGFVTLALEAGGSKRVALADAYLYAKHAKERNEYIRNVRDPSNEAGSGMTDAEADAILNWFNSLQGANRQAVAEFSQIIRQIIADTNKTRLDAGLISQEVIDAGPQWQFYVPLRGVFDPDGDREETDGYKGPSGTPRYGAAGREDPRALGRYGAARDVVANVFTQNQNAILRAERNKVGQSFLRLLEADPASTSGYAKILNRRPMMRAADESGKVREVVDPTAKNRDDILVVKRDGKEVFVEFADTRLAGAMNGKNGYSPTTFSGLVNAMSKVNRYLASINTSYNPEFMVTNAFRDLQTAGVNIAQFEREGLTKDMLGNVRSALAGIRRSIRNKDDNSEWSKIYRDFVAAGGQNATNQFNSLTEQIENIDTLLNDIAESGARGAWVKVKNSFVGKGAGSLLQLVEDYNTIVENGVRVSTYKALLDRGFTRERAAQAARNVTVNFAKGGDYRLFMNAAYLFYNASIQGTFAMLNAATKSAKVRKLWAGVVVVGILQDQLNAALSDTDDDGELIYDKIPDYVTERNLIFPDIIGLSDRSYIAIPMPYGLNMAVNLGRQMSRVARGVADPGEATGNVFSVAVDVLNPIGGTESFANAVAPTVFDPFIDMIENEDFADKPIYKEGLPFDRTPAPDSQMYWNSTSPTAKWITDNLNSLTGGNAVRSGLADFSPDVIEYWFSFLTGGVGRFVQNTAELPFNLAVDGLSDDLVRNIPVVRRAFGSVSEREDVGEYMERASRVLMAGEELKQAREAGDAQWARETIQRYPNELRLLGQVKNFETELRKISRRMNEIEKNINIPDAQKKAMKAALDQRKQMILTNANRILRALE